MAWSLLQFSIFFCECFTFWKRDCSRLHAISPSTRQTTVRVAKKKHEFEDVLSHIDVFFGFCNPYSVLEVCDMSRKLTFGAISLSSSQNLESILREFYVLRMWHTGSQNTIGFFSALRQNAYFSTLSKWILWMFHVLELRDIIKRLVFGAFPLSVYDNRRAKWCSRVGPTRIFTQNLRIL